MSSPKLERLLNLTALLLNARTPLTAERIQRDLDYPEDLIAFRRAFERDKDELREQGVPIESVGDRGDEASAYTLRARDFYLPYLCVVSARGVVQPAKVAKYGYGSLASLTFEPDELQLIGEAALRTLQVGDPALADHTRSAMRKLAFDLPVGAIDERADGRPDSDILLPPPTRPNSHTLATLGDALFDRKRVRCGYHGMGADSASTRTVEPYGLFYVSGYWYLVARDVEKDALRNFRISRMGEVTVLKPTGSKHDYEIPVDFSLREHARSRRAWDLGDLDSLEAVVEFRATSGAAVAASALGKPDAGGPSFRRFDVRRMDSFARWLLSFAGDATPVSPDALVHEYTRLVRETRERYATRG